MKTLFALLLIVASAIAVTLFAKFNPGYVLLVYPPYRVELSLGLFVVSLLLGFALLYSIIRLVSHALRLPGYVKKFQAERQRASAFDTFTQALITYYEGRFAQTEKLAAAALAANTVPSISGILAAQSAHQLRRFEARDRFLEETASRAPDQAIARLLVHAELLLEERRVDEALARLRQLNEIIPRHPPAMRLELRAQQAAKNWDQVLTLVAQLEKREAIEPVHAQSLRARAHIENIGLNSGHLEMLRRYWESIAPTDRVQTRIAIAGARGFLALGDGQRATDIIEASLAGEWDPDLVRLYGEAAPRDNLRAIERAEEWLRSHPRDPALLLALGQMCARNELWGKAESYLDASLAIAPSSDTYVALAQLMERLGRDDAACVHYQNSLRLREK